MAGILFVGSEMAGHLLSDMTELPITYTGTIQDVEKCRDLVIADNYKTVIFDLKQFRDDFHIVASEIKKMSMATQAQFVFFFIGGNKKTNIVVALVEEGFHCFVLNSLNGPAKDELQLCLAGYATVEAVVHEEPTEAIAEQSDNSVTKQIVIAIGGCCERIGTTTQALQLVKYLQFMGHRACYIQYNPREYDFVGKTKEILDLEDVDKDIGRVTFANVDMYAAPEHIAEIKSMGYEYLIYDFGHDFSVTEWLEKDIRILVCGSSPYELDCCSEFLLKGSQSYTSHIISNNKVHYIFSFVPEEDMDDIKELMESEGDHTYFSAYTPDAFTLNAANNPIYAVITEAKNITPPQKKRRFLGFFSGEKSTEK